MDKPILSMDVWNTLIVPNSDFSKARVEYLSKRIVREPSEVKEAWAAVKKEVDSPLFSETGCLSTLEVYQKLLSIFPGIWALDAVEEMKSDVSHLFLQYPPIQALGALEAMMFFHLRGHAIGISSNSNFISGTVMHQFLEKTFGSIFSFSVYSDLIGQAKPHKKFFDAVMVASGASPSDLIHVGDDALRDGASVVHGIPYVHTRPSSNLLTTMKEALNAL